MSSLQPILSQNSFDTVIPDIRDLNTPAVLFMLFNRPDLASRVFQKIRMAKPAKLFISVDGPRADCPNDVELCAECRSFGSKVDWPCEVTTLYHDSNLGCRRAPIIAISWFFEHVEEGIILEDDCLPDHSFFSFCAELLQKYRLDARIGMISGNNFLPIGTWQPDTYYYSIYNHIWGWASWRRAWATYDEDLIKWSVLKQTNWLVDWVKNEEVAKYWQVIFDTMANRGIETWDYQWIFSTWSQSQLCILPSCNLVSNIGFDPRATHTSCAESPISCLPVRSISRSLRHPEKFEVDHGADSYTAWNIFGVVRDFQT